MKKQRIFVIALAVMVVIGSLVGWLLLNKGKTSFAEAIKNPELREEYVARIVEKVGQPDYVTLVNYDDTPEEIEFLKKEYGYINQLSDLMTINAPKVLLDEVGKIVVPIRISVFPYAFSSKTITTEADFISCLLHEYRHSQVIQEGKFGEIKFYPSFLTIDQELNESLFKDVAEADALRIEIARTEISQEYRFDRMQCYMEYYTNIWSHAEKMNPDFIESLQIEFFERWMLNLSEANFVREKRDGKEIWYFKHPETGKAYYLPEEIIEKFTPLDNKQ